MVKERQLYDILEVSTEADEQEIRRAYKALALKYHPDKQPATSDADKEKMTEMFKAVSKAYDVLSDNSKRYLYDTYGEEVAVNPQEQTSVFTTNNRQYDHGPGSYAQQHQHQHQQHHQFGHTQGQRPGFPSAFSAQDMMSSHFASSNDMFNHIFNDFGANSFMNSFKAPFGMFDSGGGSSSNNNNNNNNNNNGYNEEPSRKKTVAKGKDIMDTVSCSLLDYYNGKHIKMSLCKRVKCPKCKGCGGLKIYTCNDCCGTGYIINEARNGMMYQRTQSTCARCQGTGEFIPAKYICDECGGNKLIDTKVIFDFKSPRGVGDGYRVVFPRAADEGVNLIPGDVVITLKDDPNDSTSKYRRLGNNLLTTISVPLVKALCGGRISLEHIDGKKVDIFIACGELKSANEFKVLRGYGMPIHKNSSSSSSKSENTGGNMSSDNASGNSDPAEDGNGDRPEYGDLIIRFDISFPDITAFSNKRVDLLGKVLGSSFPKDGLQMGGVSSSSSSEDISSSADDLSSFRMGESSMSSLAKNLKLSDSDTTASASVSNSNSTSTSHGHGHGTNIDISKKRALDADNDDIRYRSSHSDDSGRVRAPLARPGKASSFHAARLQDPDADLRTTLSVHDFPSVAANICFEDLDPAASMKNSNALHTSEPMDARNNPFKRTKAAEDPSSS